MKFKFLILFGLVGWLPIMTIAQSNKPNSSGTFSFYFENDFVAGTDRCFTGGFKFSWMSKDLKNVRENPRLRWLRSAFVKGTGFQNAISISLGQNIFTPDDIKRSELIKDDRPYAGILYLEVGFHSKSDRRMDTLQFDLGIVGPHSYAEHAQKFIHKLINGVWPNGWHHQLKDELVLQVIYERKWKLLKLASSKGFGFDLIPHLGGGLGNVYTYANTGMQVRVGWNLSSDFGTSLIRPGGDSNVRFYERDSRVSNGDRVGIQFFAAVDGQAVLRNIFLDGNTLRESHKVNKEPFTADVLLGMGLRVGKFNVSYTFVYWTKKFKTETREQVFGKLSLAYSY